MEFSDFTEVPDDIFGDELNLCRVGLWAFLIGDLMDTSWIDSIYDDNYDPDEEEDADDD